MSPSCIRKIIAVSYTVDPPETLRKFFNTISMQQTATFTEEQLRGFVRTLDLFSHELKESAGLFDAAPVHSGPKGPRSSSVKKEQAIRTFIAQQNKELTILEIATALKMQYSTCSWILRSLCQRKLISKREVAGEQLLYSQAPESIVVIEKGREGPQ